MNPTTLTMPSTEKKGKHLLFVHQGALGDFIVTFRVLRWLRTGFVRIDGICRSEFGQLAKHLKVIDGFYPQDAARFASLYGKAAEPSVVDLVKTYDHVLLFSFSDTLEQSLRRIKKDAVHRIAPWPREDETGQVTEWLFRRMQASKLPAIADPAAGESGPGPAINPGLPAEPDRGLRVIVCPGAGSASKRWPLDGFLQVAEQLKQFDFQPEFVIGPAEEDLQPALLAGSAATLPLHRPENLVHLAELLRSAGGYIGNDSAVSHLAAFLQLPIVSIFGPSNADRWRPTGPRVTVLRARAATGCRPSGAKTGLSVSEWLEQVPPAMVLTSFLDLVYPPGIERSPACS